jgi:hypothetical protein
LTNVLIGVEVYHQTEYQTDFPNVPQTTIRIHH